MKTAGSCDSRMTLWHCFQPPKAAQGKAGKDQAAGKQQKASKEGGGGKAKKKVRFFFLSITTSFLDSTCPACMLS